MATFKQAALTAQNTFTEPMLISGDFNISVWGTFDASVTVQRSFNSGGTWHDVGEAITDPQEMVGYHPTKEPAVYRIGIKTGDYTSGTVNVRLW